ncbi:hypothetical protein ACROYT_G003427 [Oculina patagonica]
MITMKGRSHYLVLERLGRELKTRGHEVVFFVGDSETYALKDPHVRTFKCPDEANKVDIKTIDGLMVVWRVYCDALLSHHENMEEAKTADLIIGDAMYLCSFLIADKFSLPHVTVLMSPLSTATTGLPYNFAELPSYIPQVFSRMTDDMSFVQRAQNSFTWLVNSMIFPSMLRNVYAGLKKKHNITPEKSLHQTFQKVDIVLYQSNPIDYPRPLLPNTKPVGPLLSSPAKPLPDELVQFVQGAGDEGVILVAFGSILDEIDDRTIAAMADAFSSLPQRVIWKLDEKSLTLGKNIKVTSWLPQNDILGHLKTRLFIGHAGMNGLLQAAYHGVPMICVPFFGDQFDNSIAAKHFGMAEILYTESITQETLVDAINTVLNNASYRESAARISKSIKLRPRTPIQEAADWVEYTQAQGGLANLRPRGLDLPFYQLYILDVLSVGGSSHKVRLEWLATNRPIEQTTGTMPKVPKKKTIATATLEDEWNSVTSLQELPDPTAL